MGISITEVFLVIAFAIAAIATVALKSRFASVMISLAVKVRPALVLSIGIEGEERVITTVVPHTTSVRGTRFEGAAGTGLAKDRCELGECFVLLSFAS